MQSRSQRTIRRSVETAGIGFLTGADVTIRFLPAPPHHGIAFRRLDCAGSKPIPARVEYVVTRQRRTAIEREGVAVEMIEHVMAALAGLQVDNCLVELDAPEPPGLDGSSRGFVDCLLQAGFVEQDAPRALVTIRDTLRVAGRNGGSEIAARPLARPILAVGYHLDYGPRSPVQPQSLIVEITPQTFVEQLAFARTFVLESEAEKLRAQGYGRRTTAKDLLVFGRHGIIDNELRARDECVRHKILDCVGDFALLGCDVHGYFNAYRSGHFANHEIVRRLERVYPLTESGVAAPDLESHKDTSPTPSGRIVA